MDKRFVSNFLEALFSIITITVVVLLLLFFVQPKLRFEKPRSFCSCPLGTLLLCEQGQAYLWEDFLPGYPPLTAPHHGVWLITSVQ